MTSMIYPTTNPAMSETMVVARAEGPYIYDKQGKRYATQQTPRVTTDALPNN